MKIKVVNFLSDSEKFHLKCDSNLDVVLQHLKSKYKNIRIHSVHPDEGPIVIFKPIAEISDIEEQMCDEKSIDDFDLLKCVLQVMFACVVIVVIAEILNRNTGV